MAVSLYFGLPGCGKTSLLVEMALSELNLINMGKSRYRCIVTNVPIRAEGVYFVSDFSWLGKYDFSNALCLIDEASLEFDNRDHKTFSFENKLFFLMHRHFMVDICLFVQQWDAVDKKIRVITDRVYYVHKGAIFKKLSYVNRIPYGIIIPDKKDTNSDKYGEIVQGYHRGSIFQRMFSKRLWRPIIYKYYDSFYVPSLPPLPKHLFKEFKATD